MFLDLCSRWNMDTDIAGGDAAAGPSGDRVVILPLEQSLHLTEDQCICRGEFFATEKERWLRRTSRDYVACSFEQSTFGLFRCCH